MSECIKAANATVRETRNSPSFAFALLFSNLDMISKKLDQRGRTREEQQQFWLEREKRKQQEQTRRKHILRKKFEEVRDI